MNKDHFQRVLDMNTKGIGFDSDVSKQTTNNTHIVDLESLSKQLHSKYHSKETNLILEQSTTVNAVHSYYSPSSKMCVLNFASAKNAGGSYKKCGRMAQEESLCYASNLYESSLSHVPQFYQDNCDFKSSVYLNNAIYSPSVQFVRDDLYSLMRKPKMVDVLTCPAVNCSASTIPDSVVEENMRIRIDGMLRKMYNEGCETIILGAFGCGVFENDPDMVAKLFTEYLFGKYKYQFENIVFAFTDSELKSKFENQFSIMAG